MWVCSWLSCTVRQKKRWARALHWTNIRGREIFFWMFIPIQDSECLTSLGWCGQKWPLSHRKAYRSSLTTSFFFFKLNWMQLKRCREKEDELYAGDRLEQTAPETHRNELHLSCCFPISSLEMPRQDNNPIYETAQVPLSAAVLLWGKQQGTRSPVQMCRNQQKCLFPFPLPTEKWSR